MHSNEKKYQKFTFEDFINDPDFRDWALRTDPQIDEFWVIWCENHPDKVEEVEIAKSMLIKMGQPKFLLSPDESSILLANIQSQSNVILSVTHTPAKKAVFLPYAAAVLMLMTLSFFLWKNTSTQMVHQTAFGETKEIRLPDSSVVILNSNTKVTFDTNWKHQSTRQVSIEGEAFFSITHQKDHQPFRVITSKGIFVEVLGTEFNMYHRSEETKVLLSSGLVTLSFPMNEKEGKILMEPGELVEFKESKFQRKKVNAANYISWTDNVLNLDQTTLAEIIKMAKDNYGIEVKIENMDALNKTASGTMPISDARNFMNQISKIFNIEIVYDQAQYTIK